jgi:hypothetical protein
MPINPGMHRVSAVAVGRTPFAQELALGTGEVRQLPIELPIALTVPPAPASVTASSAPATTRDAGPIDDSAVPTRTIVLVGEASLFAVGLGTGIVFSVAKSSATDRYDAANREVLASLEGQDPDGTACSTPRPGCDKLDQAQKDRERAGLFAAGGFIAAGVSAAAFGLTYWLWPRGTAPAQVQASLSPGHAGLSISGSF